MRKAAVPVARSTAGAQWNPAQELGGLDSRGLFHRAQALGSAAVGLEVQFFAHAQSGEAGSQLGAKSRPARRGPCPRPHLAVRAEPTRKY